MRTCRLMIVRQTQFYAFCVESDGNGAIRGGAPERVFEAPIVRRAVGQKVRSALGIFPLRIVETISGRKHEPLPAWASDSYAQKIRRRADGVGAAAVQAVLGMEEAEKHITVAHASAQADFAGGLQRLGQRERFKRSAIVGHQICETPVAA